MTARKAFVFDAYGTLFDVYAVAKSAEAMFPGMGSRIAVIWRDKQIEYARLVSLSDPSSGGSRYYQPFWDLTRHALAAAAGAELADSPAVVAAGCALLIVVVVDAAQTEA
ncbi:MAG: hypothetical protein EBW54_08385, partial [Betaproteobacteria bacterium]|nr:hypothetical protein [Betaproteobacteria bacterium]